MQGGVDFILCLSCLSGMQGNEIVPVWGNAGEAVYCIGRGLRVGIGKKTMNNAIPTACMRACRAERRKQVA